MKIGKFAKEAGLNKDTIRYYEKIELIHPEIIGTHRNYTEDDIVMIDIIVKLKRNGFRLAEIKKMFELTEGMDENQKLGHEHMAKIHELQEMFKQKSQDMLEREKEIAEIKAVLKKATSKIDYLLKQNTI